jgi:hypothetical protein
MKSIVPIFVGAFLAASTLHAAPKPDESKGIEPPTPIPASTAPSTARELIEFQGDEISLVLRTLARRAKISMVLDSYVSGLGTVTMRVEDKTPREAIDIIAAAKNLILDENKGVLYVRMKNPPPDPPAGYEAKADPALDAAMLSVLAPALMKMYETILDFESKPEIAQKIAKSKKILYDALIAEGFSKDQAFRLVLAHQTTLPASSEK